MVLAYEAYVIHYASSNQHLYSNLGFLIRWDCSVFSTKAGQKREIEL